MADDVTRLDEYRRKRRRGATPEPMDTGGSAGDAEPVFVVQRHDARRLHYDLRLEMSGTLASWALPKGLPLETGERYLAVHTEDHPMEYADFSGVIPKGQYGAGLMEIWDRGTYVLEERKRDGGLTVNLHGERMQGRWTLVPAHLDGDDRNWLIIKKHDDEPREAAAASTDLLPMLAGQTERLPAGDGWLFEVKWDGFRALGAVRGNDATLRSRTGVDLSSRFAAVARALPHAVRTPDCVVDGEVCALDEQGRPELRPAPARRRPARLLRVRPARAGAAAAGRPAARAAARAAGGADPARQPDRAASRPRSTTARRCTRPRSTTGWRA